MDPKQSKGMMAVFAAMLGSLGGTFSPVTDDSTKKPHNPAPSIFSRPASSMGYRVAHGTWYRTWNKRSKKERSKARREAKKAE